MRIKVNPTGTHTHKGKLKLRLDVYPDPKDRTYKLHYVRVPTRPFTEEEERDPKLAEKVPREWRVNPCLCHFVEVDEDTTPAQLREIIHEVFDPATLDEVDRALEVGDSHAVAERMHAKRRTATRVRGASAIAAANARLKGVDVGDDYRRPRRNG